jgi:hypothetical protein
MKNQSQPFGKNPASAIPPTSSTSTPTDLPLHGRQPRTAVAGGGGKWRNLFRGEFNMTP